MKRQTDKIQFFNIPAALQPSFRRSIKTGLRKFRRYLGSGRNMEVMMFYDPNDTRSFVSDGRLISDRAFFISYNLKIFRRLKKEYWVKELVGTAIHEYVHCLRFRKGSVKIFFDKLVEEGISCYFQTLFVGPPDYLDIKRTHVDDIEKWWRWWSKKYFYLQIEKVPVFETNQGYREALYRIAYHIVASFVDSHPKMSGRRLLSVPRKTFLNFARRLFTPKH